MKVVLTIWITAVLIQEVVPSTLVRRPRYASNKPSVIQTEYEAKYEQKGKNGNESFSSVSGKQHFVHDNCSENWNSFADKCASLIKDLVASLANTVSSNPGDATNLQLHIKNTFKHFDNTHNCTCLNHTGKGLSDLDLSSLFNNITISTISPSSNKEAASEDYGKHSKQCEGGVCALNSNTVQRPDAKSEGSERNGAERPNIGDPTAPQQKQSFTLTDAEELHPEQDGLDDGSMSNSRRQVNYPQVSRQPGTKNSDSLSSGREQTRNGKIPPFLATPRPRHPSGSSKTSSPVDTTSSSSIPENESFPSGGSQMSSSGTPSSASQLLGQRANGRTTPENNYAVPSATKTRGPYERTTGTGQRPIVTGTTSPVGMTNGRQGTNTGTDRYRNREEGIASGGSDSEPEVAVPTDRQTPGADTPNSESAVIISKKTKHGHSKSKAAVVIPVTSDSRSEPNGLSEESVESTPSSYLSVPSNRQPSSSVPVINSNSNLPGSSTVNPSPVYEPLPTSSNPNPSSKVTPVVSVPEEEDLLSSVSEPTTVESYATSAPTTTDYGETTTESFAVVKPISETPESANQEAEESEDRPVNSITVFTTRPESATSESPEKEQLSGTGDRGTENVVIVTPTPEVEIATVVPRINQQTATPRILESVGGGDAEASESPVFSGTGSQTTSYGSDLGGTYTEGQTSTTPVLVFPEKFSTGTSKPEEESSADGETTGHQTGQQPSSVDEISGTTPMPVYSAIPVVPETENQEGSTGDSSPLEQQPASSLNDSGSGTTPNSIPEEENSEQSSLPSDNAGTDDTSVSPSSGSQSQGTVTSEPGKTGTGVPSDGKSGSGGASSGLESEQSALPSDGKEASAMEPVESVSAVPGNEEQLSGGKVPNASESTETVPSSDSQVSSGSQSGSEAPTGGEQTGNEETSAVSEPSSSGTIPTVLETIQPSTASPEDGEQSGNEGVTSVTSGPEVQNGESNSEAAKSGGEQSGNGEISEPSAPAVPVGEGQSSSGTVPTVSEPSSATPNSEGEDSVLLKPTTFQTTSVDPTPEPPVVYQTPEDSTKSSSPHGSDSGLLVRPSTSPQTTTHDDDDDDDDDEDCCSCESCTEEEITDAKQYKENACKNLEEARRELKAIFDKIKKKLRCFSKKPPQKITSS